MRALVLSGGGSKGQYHVGAFCALSQDLGREYDIVCGVSVGALVAAHIAQYTVGEDALAAETLTTLFTPIRNRDIYKNWLLVGKLAALWEPSLFNAEPLFRLIKKKLDVNRVRKSGRKLRVGAVSLTAGEYKVFTEHDEPLHEIVYASAAFPVAFEPVSFSGEWWIDGGVRSVTPIQAAVDAGATEIDVVLTAPVEAPLRFSPEPNAIEVGLRSAELMNSQIVEDDVKKALLYNRIIEAGANGVSGKRLLDIRVIRPKRLLNEDSLRFDPVEARQLQDRGFRDALEAF